MRPTRAGLLGLILTACLGATASGDSPETARKAIEQRDCTVAISLIKPLAEQGDAAAERMLGICLEIGRGQVAPDPAEAVTWIKRAADHGDPEAAENLAFRYEYGQGVPKDPTEAVEWYRRADEEGSKSAAHSLGYLYEKGPFAELRDSAKAVAWYRKAARYEPETGPVHMALAGLRDKGFGDPEDALPPGPSFDCGRASSRIERLICSDPALGSLDRILSRSYARLLEGSGRLKDTVVTAQLMWLGQLDTECPKEMEAVPGPSPNPAVQCLKSLYSLRQVQLEGTANVASKPNGERFLSDWAVSEAYPFILRDPTHAAKIFRTIQSPQAEIGLVLVLKFSGKTDRQNEVQIQKLITHIDSERESGNSYRSPYVNFSYDGTAESLIPYIFEDVGHVTLPCELLVRNPKLLPILDGLYESGEIDPTEVYCFTREYDIPKSVYEFEDNIAPYTTDYYKCSGSGMTRRVRYGRYQKFLLELQIAPRTEFVGIPMPPASTDEMPLRLWSYESAGNRLAYLRIRQKFLTARDDLARYYERQFHLDAESAGKAAKVGLWGTIAMGGWETPPTLVMAILGEDGAPPLSTLLPEVRGFSSWPEPLLSLAVAHPPSVAPLISAGAEVNATNPFGKTPLMTAAQNNSSETVISLLKAGAAVNAVTLAPEDVPGNAPPGIQNIGLGCLAEYDITHGKRSALMYAAANASLELIRTLIDAGADKRLADSMGSTALDYLLGKGPVPANPVIRGDELQAAKRLLGL